MATLRDIDLGTVTAVTPRYVRRHSVRELVGVVGSYPQDMKSEWITFDIQGFLDNPTQAERESFNALRDGNPSIVRMAEEGLYGWAKVIENDFRLREHEAGIWGYRIPLFMIPCIGTMKALHADCRFSDLDYFSKVKSMDPFATKCNVALATALLHQHEFYVFNSAASTKTLEFEMMCGDDVNKVEVWGWKNSGWSVIGAWHSGGTAFGATAAWTDEDAQAHTFRVDHDIRGATVANFTKKVSRALGTQRRVMVQITSMTAYPATYGLSTKYGQYQLLLKVKLTHTERETGRSYAIVTYEDGGFGLGPA